MYEMPDGVNAQKIRESRYMIPVALKAQKYTNRWLYEVLPDGAWHNKSCFIVGGGPSLKGFNYSLLTGHRTIGINRAFEKFEPTIIFSMDARFLNWLYMGRYDKFPDGKDALYIFLNRKSIKVWLCTSVYRFPSNIFIVKAHKTYRTALRAFTFSMHDGIGHGDNSGYAALNLAVCLGANPIYLLGFDCSHTNGKSHCHSGHPFPQKAETVKRWVNHFQRAGQRIKPKKINVINLNPDSAITVFPKKNYREVLHG